MSDFVTDMLMFTTKPKNLVYVGLIAAVYFLVIKPKSSLHIKKPPQIIDPSQTVEEWF